MKTVCSFCDTVINPGTSSGDPVSHGVCSVCYDRILNEFGFNVKHFLDQLDVPVFIVDSDVNILAANTLALELAGQPMEKIRGNLCGEALKCINAVRPKGCGKTEYCPDCGIRSAVHETFTTGKPLVSRSAILVRRASETIEKIPFLVSTWKQGNVVLLRLQPV